MISQEAIQEILGIKDKIPLKPEDMVTKFKVTFFPKNNNASETIIWFSEKLKKTFRELGVEIISYDDAWEMVSIRRRIRRFVKYSINNFRWVFRRLFGIKNRDLYIPLNLIFRLCGGRKIKKGISVVCAGEQSVADLPMQYISTFKENSIITIVDFPQNIHQNSDFESHFNEAMKLFAYHMTNIVICVTYEKWMLYNFNASHPIYEMNENFNECILKALVPKIVAPISPHKFSEFTISSNSFNSRDELHQSVIKQLKDGSNLFEKTNLYPKGKKIDELYFRNSFHKLIGKLHLDNRNGMSFGFVAHQMPTNLGSLLEVGEFKKNYPLAFNDSDYYVDNTSREMYILVSILNNKWIIKIPPIWVMTIRSGANKTRFNVNKDLLKLGLVNGKMWMELPTGLELDQEYRPSFDSKVILAHAIGNYIIASILKHLNIKTPFSSTLESEGLAIAHWHGYFNKKYVPSTMIMYGGENPHVSCSSPQSAIYALMGKLREFKSLIGNNDGKGYNGDIHVEPHHGINVTFNSLSSLANFILNNPEATSLGNKYIR